MKILMLAYTCETGRGSEGEIGWRMGNTSKNQIYQLKRPKRSDLSCLAPKKPSKMVSFARIEALEQCPRHR